MSDSQVLPLEPGSRSELLATRNVFSIEVLNLSASAWKLDESIGLESRTVTMNARLLHVFKGPDRPAAHEAVAALRPGRRRRHARRVHGQPRLGLHARVMCASARSSAKAGLAR